jgi:hypothetical protein
MSKFTPAEWLIAAGLALILTMPSGAASGAVAEGGLEKLAEAFVGSRSIGAGTAEFEMRFIQEDGPESGHVRVVLTPEGRPVSALEARAAAQDAFLEALADPSLRGALRRVVVVVRQMPATHPDPAGTEQTFLFLRKLGSTWSVLPGQE